MSAVQNDTLKINHCVNRAAPVSIYRDWPASLHWHHNKNLWHQYFLYTCEKGNLSLVNLTFVVILSCQHLLSRSFYYKNKSIFTIIFWADNHAFRTVAIFDNASWSLNQNKKLVPTRISQIAQTNSFTHRWRLELWRWCGRDYHVTFQSFTNNFRWNLWRSECAKMVINFFWRSLSFSKFALLQRVRIVNGIQPENC